MSRGGLRRVGWVLAVVGTVAIPVTWDSLWLLGTSAVLWGSALALAAGYRDHVYVPSQSDAAEQLVAEGRAA